MKLFMEQINQSEKTLVFCATQDHALAVRDLVNQMKTSQDPNYCQRAATVFRDSLSATGPDPDHSVGEERFVTFGVSTSGSLLAVAHT